MVLDTTVVGSMPKPSFLDIPVWIENGEVVDVVQKYNDFLHEHTKQELDEELLKAFEEVIAVQEEIGIDIITDGEIGRENYIYSFCRNLEGFDFTNLCKKSSRNGAFEVKAPCIVSSVSSEFGKHWLEEEWRKAQSLTDRRIKITVPGPMTIIDTVTNNFYANEEDLSQDLVKCINREVKALAKAGCTHIQIDEPVLNRNADKALKYGIKHLASCFEGISDDVCKIIHICCGYPNYLDQKDYPKAPQDSYFKLAANLDNAGFDAISIEDAHRRNNLSLFSQFKKTKVMLGVVDVASSRVETVEEIRQHIAEVLEFIPPERLIIAPDCGLLFLSMDLAKQKLTNMVKAAKLF